MRELLYGWAAYPASSMYPRLRDYQIAHPTVTLSEVLTGIAPGGSVASDAMYTSSAIIVQAIYRRSGIAGLRRFAAVSGGPDKVLQRVPEFLGLGGDQTLDDWWRAETAELSTPRWKLTASH